VPLLKNIPGFIVLLAMLHASGVQANLLTNSGFEMGDFSGWSLDGWTILGVTVENNSPQSGVAADGTLLPGAHSLFGDTFQNVRSGNYAGNASVCCGELGLPYSAILLPLSQTVSVTPDTLYDVGFWLGNDSSNAFGVTEHILNLQIFIDDTWLFTEIDSYPIDPGGDATDFVPVSATFNSGNKTSIDVRFAITGSGSGLANASFDDFYLRRSVPVPPVLPLFVLSLVCLACFPRMRRIRGQSRMALT
jgi:hypothetical protein